MKTTVIATFYSNYSTLNRRLCQALDLFKRVKKYYDAVALGDIITDAEDYGISALEEPKLIPFFDDLKSCTSELLDSIRLHVEQKGIYDALGLGDLIGNADNMGDGVTGAELKGAITSIGALDAELTSAYHYTNLYKIKYTAKRQSADWEPGITGAGVKSIINSMAAADTFLTSGWHYTNLDKLL